MRPKILSVDFDGTLVTSAYPEIGKQKWIHRLLLKWLLSQQKKGAVLILNTLRTKQEHLDLAVKWCRDQGLFFYLVNENYSYNIKKFGESRKIGADLHIDDKNIGPFGWLLRRMDSGRKRD